MNKLSLLFICCIFTLLASCQKGATNNNKQENNTIQKDTTLADTKKDVPKSTVYLEQEGKYFLNPIVFSTLLPDFAKGEFEEAVSATALQMVEGEAKYDEEKRLYFERAKGEGFAMSGFLGVNDDDIACYVVWDNYGGSMGNTAVLFVQITENDGIKRYGGFYPKNLRDFALKFEGSKLYYGDEIFEIVTFKGK